MSQARLTNELVDNLNLLYGPKMKHAYIYNKISSLLSKITILDLSHREIRDDDWVYTLFRFFNKNTTIKTLKFSNSYVGEAIFGSLTRFLEHNDKLTHLILNNVCSEHYPVSNIYFDPFCDALATNTILISLDLSYNKFTVYQIKLLVDVLRRNHTLRYFVIDEESIPNNCRKHVYPIFDFVLVRNRIKYIQEVTLFQLLYPLAIST